MSDADASSPATPPDARDARSARGTRETRETQETRETADAPRELTRRTPIPVPPLDRHFWLCLLVVAAVLMPRSWMITKAHNECMDTDYHLRHGLAVLLGTRDQIIMGANDPPLGQMILALPMAVTGNIPSRPINLEHWPKGATVPGARPSGEPKPTAARAEYERTIRTGVLYGNAWSPEALLQLIGLWKSALFIPCMLVIFQWCRALYGAGAAWLGQALLLADPTLAAHLPIAALDTLAVEGIVIACFCIWRYFERPTLATLTMAAVSTAAAVLIKHTAVITPGVLLLFAAYYWGWRPWRDGVTRRDWRATLRPRMNALAAALLLGLLAMWALLLFDVSVPAEQLRDTPLPRPTSAAGEVLDNFLHLRMPLGTYVGCFASGFLTNSGGQRALLFGQISRDGFAHYFPALMTFKVPLGAWVVLVLAGFSLLRRPRVRRGEVSILIPLCAWLAFLLTARMNTGFRHFLPAYVFLLMWASRCVADAGRPFQLAAWAGAIFAAVHPLLFHPDYLSYINFPRNRVWMQITDSNLDWGQGIRQVGPWLDRHPPDERRPVHLFPRSGRTGLVGPYYLGDRVNHLERGKPPPTSGLLIISPVWVSGVYDDPGENAYEFLQSAKPIGWVGHAMLIYDLDAIQNAPQGGHRPPPSTLSTTKGDPTGRASAGTSRRQPRRRRGRGARAGRGSSNRGSRRRRGLPGTAARRSSPAR